MYYENLPISFNFLMRPLENVKFQMLSTRVTSIILLWDSSDVGGRLT